MAQVVRKDIGGVIQIPVKIRQVGGQNDGQLHDHLGARITIQDPDGNDVTDHAAPNYVKDGYVIYNWDTEPLDPDPGPGDYLVTPNVVAALDVDGNRIDPSESIIYRLTRQGAT